VTELANYIYPAILQNNEFLFALCDIALMHPLPGWAFYKILTDFKEQNFQPKNDREIIESGYLLYQQWGWDVFSQFEKALERTLQIVEQLYGHEHIQHTLTWFQTILALGYQIRKNYPYFFLDIFNDTEPLSDALSLVWINLGGHHCINRNFERSMRCPAGLEENFGKIHPQHLKISWQLNQFLSYVKVSC